ncbi:unnamed protein product [Leptosia nina]|uniref:Uncharacterized protein n=1 Tax=Leptosia nina TaxID=320188 RepID=A0AAV1IZN7_9NEOP
MYFFKIWAFSLLCIDFLLALVDNTTETYKSTIDSLKEMVENSTSCEDLLSNYTFDQKTVIDVDWKMFFYWNYDDGPSCVFKFSPPYPVLIDRYRSELNITPPVNWNNSILFMETSTDVSAMLVSTDVLGKFRIISSTAFEVDTSYTEMAIKVVPPGYLIMLQCDFRFGFALAPYDKMPNEKNIDEAVHTLGIKSNYNKTYIYEEFIEAQLAAFEEDHLKPDDDVDDVDDDDEEGTNEYMDWE